MWTNLAKLLGKKIAPNKILEQKWKEIPTPKIN
jgi:hypothetical protein